MKFYSKGINFPWNLTFADFADFTKICEYKAREIFDFHSFSRISFPPPKKLKIGQSAKFLKHSRPYFYGLVRVLELKIDKRLKSFRNCQRMKCQILTKVIFLVTKIINCSAIGFPQKPRKFWKKPIRKSK